MAKMKMAGGESEMKAARRMWREMAAINAASKAKIESEWHRKSEKAKINNRRGERNGIEMASISALAVAALKAKWQRNING